MRETKDREKFLCIIENKTKVIFMKINPTEKPPQNNKKPNAIQRIFAPAFKFMVIRNEDKVNYIYSK